MNLPSSFGLKMFEGGRIVHTSSELYLLSRGTQERLYALVPPRSSPASKEEG